MRLTIVYKQRRIQCLLIPRALLSYNPFNKTFNKKALLILYWPYSAVASVLLYCLGICNMQLTSENRSKMYYFHVTFMLNNLL